MASYGYLRKDFPIPTMKQLQRIMPYECDELFIEEANLEEEKEYIKLIDQVKSGDTIVIYHSSVFGKNLRNYAQITESLNDSGIYLIVLSEDIDTHQMTNYYEIVKRLADMEYIVIQNRTLYGIEMARKNGRIGGRPKIDSETRAEILRLRNTKNLSLRDISEACHVSLGTVHKYIKSQPPQKLENPSR